MIKSGFTLVEIIVALGIISASGLFAMQAMTNITANMNELNRQNEIMYLEESLVKMFQKNRIACKQTFGGAFSGATLNGIGSTAKTGHSVSNVTINRPPHIGGTEVFLNSGTNPTKYIYTKVGKILLLSTQEDVAGIAQGLKVIENIGNMNRFYIYEAYLQVVMNPKDQLSGTAIKEKKTSKIYIMFDYDKATGNLECYANFSHYLSLANSCRTMFDGVPTVAGSNISCLVGGNKLLQI